ncbi:MAG: nucleoside-triphosphatase [Dehalococcoidia bacterium]|nr:nucleoside-triphosphatase [Dehalococcoidia bacterium]
MGWTSHDNLPLPCASPGVIGQAAGSIHCYEKVRHLFLQGQPGIGKSSLLRKALESIDYGVAGFATQRLKENSRTTGYRVLQITNGFPLLDEEYTPSKLGVFLLNGQQNIPVLEAAISQVEEDSKNPNCNIIVLDEIGGIELVSDVFMKTLLRIISGRKPCIGVLKSAQNLSHTVSKQNLSSEYLILHKQLEQEIQSKSELITVTDENKFAMQEYLARYLRHSTQYSPNSSILSK